MPSTDRALALLTAQLRAYGGRIVTNVVNGHNVTEPDEQRTEARVAGSRSEGDARERLLRHLRTVLARARNGYDSQPRYDVVFAPTAADGYPDDIPADWAAVIETSTGNAVALCHKYDVQAVIAGLADWEVTRPR